jgi:hypothetical protein
VEAQAYDVSLCYHMGSVYRFLPCSSYGHELVGHRDLRMATGEGHRLLDEERRARSVLLEGDNSGGRVVFGSRHSAPERRLRTLDHAVYVVPHKQRVSRGETFTVGNSKAANADLKKTRKNVMENSLERALEQEFPPADRSLHERVTKAANMIFGGGGVVRNTARSG